MLGSLISECELRTERFVNLLQSARDRCERANHNLEESNVPKVHTRQYRDFCIRPSLFGFVHCDVVAVGLQDI
jgi:hypothetical protein